MDNEELKYSQVGNIRIKEPKKKKKNIKKKNDDGYPFLIKAFVWFMFIAMFLSFAGPLAYYLISYMTSN